MVISFLTFCFHLERTAEFSSKQGERVARKAFFCKTTGQKMTRDTQLKTAQSLNKKTKVSPQSLTAPHQRFPKPAGKDDQMIFFGKFHGLKWLSVFFPG